MAQLTVPGTKSNINPVAGAVVVAGLIALLIFVVANADSTGAKVTSWRVGSPTVDGTVRNGTGQGCSHMWVTLHLRDHNGAIIRDFRFGAGEVSAHSTTLFETRMVTVLLADDPVPPSTATINAEAECLDER